MIVMGRYEGAVDDMVAAVRAAEARARADHDAGLCQASEWSCSWCS